MRWVRKVLGSVGMAMGMLAAAAVAPAVAGPYAPGAGVTGTTAIAKNDAAFVAWATGWLDYVVGADCDATWQTPAKALGAATGSSTDICCLGNGGTITLTFDEPIIDGEGADFAVFENGFSNTFLELAYVEVSADGATWVRFPNYSETASPVGGFGSIDPTNIMGLGSKYRVGYGEPYDLADVGLAEVSYVRLVDIIGDDAHGNLDSNGHIIYDLTPTTGSGGFDLEAVGVLHQAPEPATLVLVACGAVMGVFNRQGRKERKGRLRG